MKQLRERKNPVIRNYGLEIEIEELRRLEEELEKEEEEEDAEEQNVEEPATDQIVDSRLTDSRGGIPQKKKKISEIKLTYGFLRRLEEEGKNVKIGQEINDILFMEEKEKAIKERLEEEQKRKMKKPRPREIVDFDDLKRRQMQNQYMESLRQQKMVENERKLDLSRLIEVGQTATKQ